MNKKTLIIAAVLTFGLGVWNLGLGTCSAQNIGINTTGAAPNASAALDIDINQKGLLIPRMSTADRNLIASPANSLMIYNTTDNCLQIFIGTWQNIYCGCTSPPGAAGSITSSTPVCQNQNGVSYSIPAITGATGYVWTYTGTGFTIASGNNTNAITANFSATATGGNLTVYATNACGNGTASPAFFITVNSIPTGVTASASPNPICVGNTLNLTGAATGATTWSWVGPNGFTSTLQSPTIASITTAGAGIYTLTATNSCGSATPVNTASVTVVPGIFNDFENSSWVPWVAYVSTYGTPPVITASGHTGKGVYLNSDICNSWIEDGLRYTFSTPTTGTISFWILLVQGSTCNNSFGNGWVSTNAGESWGTNSNGGLGAFSTWQYVTWNFINPTTEITIGSTYVKMYIDDLRLCTN